MLQKIKVSEAKGSATNPRPKAEFQSPEFDELVKSVKEKGILVPVLARAVKGAGKGIKWEVIAGSRRLAAAKKVGLAEIPAQVVVMTDAEAQEAAIVENLQRKDIHPVDEGIAYRALLESTKGYDTKVIAAKVGKSETYVRQRLHLTDLTPKARELFREGKLNAVQAVMVARLPEKMQAAALKQCAENDYDISGSGDLREWIQENMTAELSKNPPWGKGSADESVVASVAGPCAECPKSADLFGKNASEVCPNPACYSRRIAAWLELKKKEYADKKQPLAFISLSYSTKKKGVLGDNEYRKVPDEELKRSDHATAALIVEGHRDVGKVITICPMRNCKDKKHNPYYTAPYKPTAKELEKRKKQEEADERANKREAKKLADTIASIVWPFTNVQLDVLLELAIEETGWECEDIAKARGLSLPKVKAKHQEYQAWKDVLKGSVKTNQEKAQLVFELMLQGNFDARIAKLLA